MSTVLAAENPVFAAYMVAAALMVLKIMGQGWMTVYRMMTIKGGFVSPEDLRPGPINPEPRPEQLDANDYVERSRRMHRNDLENIPAFLACGLIFVAAGPPAVLAYVLLYGFVLARLAHTLAYASGQSHEIRATFYTIGSVAVVAMALFVLWATLI